MYIFDDLDISEFNDKVTLHHLHSSQLKGFMTKSDYIAQRLHFR